MSSDSMVTSFGVRAVIRITPITEIITKARMPMRILKRGPEVRDFMPVGGRSEGRGEEIWLR